MLVRVFPHVGTSPTDIAGFPVVIDALRATSTIVAALQAGASAIAPVATLEAALEIAGCLRAGERGGFRPNGFDLGNSPLEMTPDRVAGRRLVLTTTNGSLALLEARRAGPVLCASFLNLSAVVRSLADKPAVTILCAGSEGCWSAEDLAVAGGIVSALAPDETNDLAALARLWFEHHRGDLRRFMRGVEHGRYLCRAGFAPDVDFCAQLDWSDVVPVYDSDVRAL